MSLTICVWGFLLPIFKFERRERPWGIQQSNMTVTTIFRYWSQFPIWITDCPDVNSNLMDMCKEPWIRCLHSWYWVGKWLNIPWNECYFSFFNFFRIIINYFFVSKMNRPDIDEICLNLQLTIWKWFGSRTHCHFCINKFSVYFQ